MIIMCAWCNKNMGQKKPLPDKTITHGICKPCADHLKANFKIIVPSWGDRVEIPKLNRTKVL